MQASVLVIALAFAAPALKDKPIKPGSLVGDWVVVRWTCAGRAMSVGEFEFTFGNDGTWHTANGGTREATRRGFSFDASATPARIDLTISSGMRPTLVKLGIYRIEAETLTLCLPEVGDARPLAFEAPSGTGRSLLVLKRKPKGE